MATSVRKISVYRLKHVQPTAEGIFDAMATGKLVGDGFDVDTFEIGDVPAVLFTKQLPEKPTGWCETLSALTARPIELNCSDAAAVLVMAIGDTVLATGYGMGYQYIPSDLKVDNFGLQIALRVVNPDKVREVSRRSMAVAGRQDDTYITSGIPISSIGIREWTELVKRLGGVIDAAELGLDHRQRVAIRGGSSLIVPMPVDPERFVNVLRRIAAIGRREIPAEFELLEAIQLVTDEAVCAELESRLAACLREDSDAVLDFAMPIDLTDYRHEVTGYILEIGSTVQIVADLSQEVVRGLCCQTDNPAEALHNGTIGLILGQRPDDSGPDTAADLWLEASISIGSRIYWLCEGEWLECGTAYMQSIDRNIRELMLEEPSIVLPAWHVGELEKDYNERVQKELGPEAFLCLDTKLIRTSVHNGNGFEPCDGFTDARALVHIKGADRAAPLSHQVNQAYSSVEALFAQAEARKKFSKLVADTSDNKVLLLEDFRPTKVILGIKLKGKDATAENLYPLAKVAIVNMAKNLEQYYGVTVEVVAIPEGRGEHQS
ncbi:DUF6119 family protein [Nocardia sp. NPDC058058]|uniref:DUF6119 family protein n=1 Tax=Nocardia sp. NPDC058058 TaxID=3346317 RepID=UPI0036DAD96B